MRCTRRERSRSRGGLYDHEQLEVPESPGSGGTPSRASSGGVPGSGASAAPEVCVLYASPPDRQLPQIDVQAELDALSAAIRQAQGSVHLRVGIATTKSLAQLLTRARSAARQTVLHLSAHVATHEQRGAGLVLENPHGGAHVLDRTDLEGLLGAGQRLEGLPLVFLNSCWSESIAQLFVESGCRHVVATRGEVPDAAARAFTQQFYLALCSQQSVMSSWVSAQQLLRVDSDPRLPPCADLFVLFGQRNAPLTTLWAIGAEATAPRERQAPQGLDSGEETPPGSLVIENPMVPSELEACKLPPRVEDFVGRGGALCEILRNLVGRRACIVSGPAGIGKSALAVELAHFASAPGRLFSRGVLFVCHRGRPEAAAVQRSIAECVRAALPDFFGVGAEAGASLSRAFQHLERRCGRQLLVLDDAAGALRASAEVRQTLKGLLEDTRSLCLAAFSRERVYDSLGDFKCVNVCLPALPSLEAAQLFLKRVHRPLRPGDLERGAAGQGAVRASSAMLSALGAHPLLRQLAGNPGDLRAASQRVTPELGSLFELCAGGGAGAGGAAAHGAATPSAAEGQRGTLPRAMSIDGGPRGGAQLQLSRQMSVDEGPPAAGAAPPPPGLPRVMSVDYEAQ